MIVKDLNPQGISVGKRMRPLDPATIDMLKKSIKQIGLINPITVTRFENGQPDLICGHHRLVAVKGLNLDSIACHIIESIEDQSRRLMEIAENYCSAGLTTAQRAEHAKEYAELSNWKLDARGGDRRSIKQDRVSFDKPSATKELSEKSGREVTGVRKDIQIAKEVDGEVLRLVAGTPIDSRDQLLALGKLPKEQQRKIAKQWTDPTVKRRVKPTTIAGQLKRTQREQDLGTKIAKAAKRLDGQMYGVIIADPPWSRETWSEAGKSRDPANHYPTMLKDQIQALEIPAAPDCILFLWSTGEHLEQAMLLLEAWGFQYKSNIIWVKPSISTGYWVRTRHEIVLIATKGSPVAPAPGTQMESIFEAPAGEHSAKPPIIHEMVERLWPSLPKLEMFARTKRDGWSGWGAEFEDYRDLDAA